MVFSSHIFVYYFLPIALLLYYLLPRNAKHLGLTFLSYLFYGWAHPPFVLLMFASTLIDYTCGTDHLRQQPNPSTQTCIDSIHLFESIPFRFFQILQLRHLKFQYSAGWDRSTYMGECPASHTNHLA